ncbi:DUF1127 domain-containing protein [Roseomonas sp. CCTCC AB2023176]|uniref:DUF1127 domain-containing protein n=1 Tax=Roseomonas sp. CCTCC AB2023176 TaxID=3342640 RepID=UPI0035E31C51
MSGHVIPHPALARTGVAHAAQAGRARAVTGMWLGMLNRMTRAIEERRLLATLDDRMLSDIGVTRSEAYRESGRAPWDLR